MIQALVSLVKGLVHKLSNMDTKTKERILVWVKSERAGDIVTVDEQKSDSQWTQFTDGTKCNSSLVNEFLMPATSEASAESMSRSFQAVNELPTVQAEVVQEPTVNVNTTTPVESTTKEVNVMLEMLRKLSAKNTISMPLELNIPSKEVYELFKDQMDITKADLNEQILLLVLSQIDNLQEQLRPQAEEFINNYYNGRKNTTNTRGNSTGSSVNTGRTSGSAPDITY